MTLYFVGVTSPLWSISAGVGDMIAATAMVWMCVRGFQRGWLSKRAVVFWSWFGLLDFVHALVLAVLLIPSPIGPLAGDTAATDASVALSFPFNVVPGMLVPLLFPSHLVMLLQARRHGAAIRFAPRGAPVPG